MKFSASANGFAPGAPGVDGQGSWDGVRYDDHLAKLEYARQMLIELRRLAAGVSEHTLVYLIEMAAEHAGDRLRDARASLERTKLP